MENEGKEGKPGVQNPAHKLMERLQENKDSLHIRRVPEKTKKAFLALAKEEFMEDYGFCLKWLMDNINQETGLIIAKIDEHEMRIQNLESAAYQELAVKKEPEFKEKRMLDGKIKKMGRLKT